MYVVYRCVSVDPDTGDWDYIPVAEMPSGCEAEELARRLAAQTGRPHWTGWMEYREGAIPVIWRREYGEP